jgi:hypothetical protein
MTNNFYRKYFYYYFLNLFFITVLFGCNKKYYAKVTSSRDDEESAFVILNSGEKIKIKDASISKIGILRNVTFMDSKNYLKKEIAVVQNSKAFYKRLNYKGASDIKNGQFSQMVNFEGDRFVPRYKKGAINVYLHTTVSTYNTPKGLTTNTFYLYFLEKNDTKETLLYYDDSNDNVLKKIESWINSSSEASKIIQDWNKLNIWSKSNYKGDPYLNAIDKYNSENKNGNISN